MPPPTPPASPESSGSPGPTDAELVERHRQGLSPENGEASAFEQLVERWNDELFQLAYRLCGDVHQAQDVRQLAFLKLHQGLVGFRGESSLRTWLFRVTLNLCRDQKRRRDTHERALNGHATRDERELFEREAPDRASERSELSERLGAAVDGLPEEEREVIVLRHFHGLSFPRIADLLQTPETTVKSRMTRGLRRLQERLRNLDR